MANLIRGNELELAVCVGTVIGEGAAQATQYALELLARKCMTVTTWYVLQDDCDFRDPERAVCFWHFQESTTDYK